MSQKDEAKALLNAAKVMGSDVKEILGDGMKRVLKIEHAGLEEQPCYAESMFDIEGILESMLGGDEYWHDDYDLAKNLITISIVEISLAEWEALEEFEGFI